VKIYDDINKSLGSKLSANVFRRMIETSSRGHDAETSSGIAKALQHSEETALNYYRVPDTAEVMRRQEEIDKVTHTELVRSFVAKQ